MKVTIYSTTSCPYCTMLKDYLDSKNIFFEEKLVDQNEEFKTEMLNESNGFLGVPFVVIVKDDNSKETVLGFDKGKLDQVLI